MPRGRRDQTVQVCELSGHDDLQRDSPLTRAQEGRRAKEGGINWATDEQSGWECDVDREDCEPAMPN